MWIPHGALTWEEDPNRLQALDPDVSVRGPEGYVRVSEEATLLLLLLLQVQLPPQAHEKLLLSGVQEGITAYLAYSGPPISTSWHRAITASPCFPVKGQ